MKLALASIFSVVALFSNLASAQFINKDYQAQLDFAHKIVQSSSVSLEFQVSTTTSIVRVVRASRYASMTDKDMLYLAYLKDDEFRTQVDSKIPQGSSIDRDALTQGVGNSLTCDLMDLDFGVGLILPECKNLNR